MTYQGDKSIYMRPRLTQLNAADGDSSDPVLPPEFSRREIGFPDISNGLFIQLRCALFFATGNTVRAMVGPVVFPKEQNLRRSKASVPPLAEHVLHVVPLRPQHEMAGTATCRVIAYVHDIKALIKRPILDQIGNAVSLVSEPIHIKSSIPAIVRSGLEFPTVIISIGAHHLRLESFNISGRKVREWFRITSHSMLHSLSAMLRAVDAAPGLIHASIPKAVLI